MVFEIWVEQGSRFPLDTIPGAFIHETSPKPRLFIRSPEMDDRESHESEPYDLDQEAAADEQSSADGSRQDVDDANCNGCGAPESEDADPVCPSCGHDKVGGTVKGRTEGVSGRSAEIAMPALVKSESVRIWLIMAAVSTAILVVAWLAGWSSLFSRSEGMYLDASGAYTLDSPRFTERVLGVIRWLVAGATLVGLGSGALRITAWISSRSVGNWAAVGARICWLVAIAGLATLIPIHIS